MRPNIMVTDKPTKQKHDFLGRDKMSYFGHVTSQCTWISVI